ncbi:MAG: methyltransferase domain-containing protein, partial [Bacteroidetes bacterium]|nr:methyltransferase domain-containing protein [Bacteroidota bacterium]
MVRLNLGCGPNVITDWVNVDYAFGAKLAKYKLFKILNKKYHLIGCDWNPDIFIHNLTKKFPWVDNSVDIIYSSHTLEHLSKNEGIFFISECYRVLKGNGVIRIIVPDLLEIINQYREGKIAANDVLEELGVLTIEKNNINIRSLIKIIISTPHKCMYDCDTLLNIMKSSGFKAQEKKAFDSVIKDISKIEIITADFVRLITSI